MAMHKIAVISDTHNLLRPEILSVLNECEAILHAGDISSRETFDRLQEIKEVYAVRGNTDRGWANDIPLVLQFELYGFRFCMTHIKRNIPTDHNADVVICGHSHRYSCSKEGNTLYLNPGSCGPRRFNQDITMAILTLYDSSDESGRKMDVERIDIPHEAPSGKNKTQGTRETKNSRSTSDYKRTVTTDLVRRVCSDVDREKTIDEIAARRRIDPELAEQIARMYLTHQEVTPEQIMAKLGL